jgi:hypothetical protein
LSFLSLTQDEQARTATLNRHRWTGGPGNGVEKVKPASVKKLRDLPAKAKGVRGGAANYYMQFGGTSGESTDTSHKDWIMIKKP